MSIKKQLAFILVLLTPLVSYSSILSGNLKDVAALSYSHESESGYTNPKWMQYIPDNKLISELSIPGTNQSLSLYGGDNTQTQSFTLKEQLYSGVRFFDVSFKYMDGDIYAFNHGTHQNRSFSNFLNQIEGFLHIHRSEVIIIHMRNTNKLEENKKAFIKRFIEINREFKANHYIPKVNNFYLGDARGKFVYINDFELKNKIGMSKNSMLIQNENDPELEIDLPSKWSTIKQHFINLSYLEEPAVSINFLTLEGNAPPYFIAGGKINNETFAPQAIEKEVFVGDSKQWEDFIQKNCRDNICDIEYSGINQLTLDWIRKQSFNSNLGVVVVNFPGGALLQAIIDMNQDLLETMKKN